MTMGQLTIRQANFCREYVKDFNGLQAAIRAGYSKLGAKEAGYRLLTHGHVKKLIAQLQDGVVKKAKLTAQEIVEGIEELAQSCALTNPAVSMRAYETLAKMQGILTDRVEHSGTVTTECKFYVEFIPKDNKKLLDVTES